MAIIAKSLRLFDVLKSNPLEFYDRVRAITTVQLDRFFRKPPRHAPISWDLLIRNPGAITGHDLSNYLSEPHLQQIEEAVLRRIDGLPSDAPFHRGHNGDISLARLCYAICRAMRPETALETGTCYGVTSAFILKALEVNAQGVLHSIDLPPLGKDGDKHVGRLIPEELKTRWRLYRGISGRVLPPLLSRLGIIDLFIHDSLHTYSNMKMEFTHAWTALRPGGVLIADDVEGNVAFQELAARPDVECSFALQQQKDSVLAVAVKCA
ncbi:MAG TPA: class I SAM-dependent methyltransferase [Candidatus Angelobacter sp.]|nr:class I SAM-dependent methyltransferase [Candidatus Angelobacter sp.]